MTRRLAAKRSGFTLIEMLVTVAIVALLATVALPMAQVVAKRSKEQELRLALRDIRGALDAYKQAVEEGRIESAMQRSGYPPSLELLVEGVPDASSPETRRTIRFLRRVPRDPMTADPERPDVETWGKRSYESSREAPEAGEDVFDVYSLSPGVGLNGVPYRDW